MPRLPTDWHPEDVKAAVRKTGSSLTALALANGLSESALRRALLTPWPRAQAIIAKHLGRKPQAIWPSRYDARGVPLSGISTIGRRNPSPPRIQPHRQKVSAA